MDYKFFPDLAAEVNIPQDGILSRVLYTDDHVRVVIFGFAPGQELTEHTSKMPALLHVLSGELKLKLGGKDEMEAKAGTLVHMAPNLAHGLLAKTPCTVLLTLIKGGAAA